MLAIAGTVPEENFPLIHGNVRLEKDILMVCDRPIPVNRGTPALLAAAAKACDILGLPRPFGYLVGDTGLGHGSKRLYDFLLRDLGRSQHKVMAFHYLQPDVDRHNRVLFTLDKMDARPLLIADAGYMYAAKMSGQAGAYDLFTPDVGEMAFLADEEAPHPFYTRGFLLSEESRVPEQIKRAYVNQNASRFLLVKGEKDYIASSDGIIYTVTEPSEENMEPIGGTGDTLTGIASALIASGRTVPEAAFLAARANRVMGKLAAPTPASGILELLPFLQKALEQVIG